MNKQINGILKEDDVVKAIRCNKFKDMDINRKEVVSIFRRMMYVYVSTTV